MAEHGGSVRPNSISSFDAVRELYQRVKAAAEDADPAPWFEVSPVLVGMFSEGDETAYVRRAKLYERSKLVMLRGLLSGKLVAHFSDGREAHEVPGWAWESIAKNERLWIERYLALSALLPDEWLRWSCQPVFLDRGAFTRWIDSQDLADTDGLPELPSPYDALSKPELVKKRLPPDNPFVTLSEAVSWIAFGISLDKGRLTDAIDSFELGEAEETQHKLEEAVATLTRLASGKGNVLIRGKYKADYLSGDVAALTDEIDPVRFHDFTRFEVVDDTLRYGSGLGWIKRDTLSEILGSERRDAIVSVTVNRADLLRLFPDQDDTARAFLSPLPAFLPHVGPVMALDEALSWLATGKPSNDIEIWKSAAGDLIIRDPSGNVIQPSSDGSPPPFIESCRQASRAIHAALRDGSLPSYVAPTTSAPLMVPRFYWNGVNPEVLHHVYRGMAPADHCAGCAVLLSRQTFDAWRATIPPIKVAERPRPSHSDVVAWCKQWIESGKGNGMDKAWLAFRALPEHVGLSRDDVFRPAWTEAKTR